MVLLRTEIRTVETADGFLLSGPVFRSERAVRGKPTAVVFFDGAGMDFDSSNLALPLAEALTDEGITFAYATHRGTGLERFLKRRVPGHRRSYQRSVLAGHANERFSDSPNDVVAWVRSLASEYRIILAGHSLGAAKVVYAMQHGLHIPIDGLALLAPTDLISVYRRIDRDGSIRQASRSLCEAGKGETFVPIGGRRMAAGTLLEALDDGSVADIFRFRSNDLGPVLQPVTSPLLALFADRDIMAVNPPQVDGLRLLGAAPNAVSTSLVIAHGDHDFRSGSDSVARSVSRWAVEECLSRQPHWYEDLPGPESVLRLPSVRPE